MQRGPDERDLLAHPLGEGAQPSITSVCELEGLEQLVDPPPPKQGLQPVDGAEMIEVGAGGHALVEARHFRHQSDERTHGGRVVGGVDAVNPHGARAREQHAGHAPKRCRLAGAIAAEQHEALALVDLDGQIAEPKHLPIALGQAFDLQHG